MAITTIVAALALETDNDPVAGRALQLARLHDAKLVFVHVVEDVLSFDVGLPAPVEAAILWRLVEHEATERVKKLVEHSGLKKNPEIIVATGSPFEIINETAARHKADLVIIGQGKRRNIREKVFGSTADRVVRLARVPVLVVKSAEIHAYEHMSVAVDFSDASKAALKAAADLAPNAAVTMIHVVEIPLAFEQAMLQSGTGQMEIKLYRQAKIESARKKLKESFAEAGFSAVDEKLRVLAGHPVETLSRHARGGRTDLFVLGTQGRNPVSQVLLGSVARRILQVAPCDVLITSGRLPAIKG